MDCCNQKAITIVRGNDTDFNGANFLTINFNTEILDLSTFKATFTLGNIVKTFTDLSSGSIVVNFTAQETNNLPPFINGVLKLEDENKKVATIESLIPFKTVSVVDGNAIATEPYTLNFDVKQGGETILTVNVESAVTVEVGTTTTLPAGSDATVTNSGTGNHLVLNFGIPEGNGIASIEKTSTTGLVDTYTVTFDKGNTTTFDVTNGNGIVSISKTDTSGLVDTYTITFDNGNSSTFTVTNGSSIASIEKTSTSGLVDTYTITLTNGDTSTFTVTNGKDGTDGKDGKDGVDGVSPTASVTQTPTGATITVTDAQGTTTANITNGQDGTDGTNATITGATASVTNTVGTPSVTVTAGGTESARSFNFAFTNLKGDKGDTGAGMVAEVVQTLPLTGETGKIYLVPKTTPAQEDIYDEYIWAIIQSPDTYGWEHIGSTDIDLTGYVQSVNNQTPDSDGNVSLTIPTVNDATLTITQGGTTKGTFTANSSTDTTINLDAGTAYTAGTGIDINNNNTINIVQSEISNVPINVAGILTNNDNVYSGFSDSNYLYLNFTDTVTGSSDIEFNVRCVANSTNSCAQETIAMVRTDTSGAPLLNIRRTNSGSATMNGKLNIYTRLGANIEGFTPYGNKIYDFYYHQYKEGTTTYLVVKYKEFDDADWTTLIDYSVEDVSVSYNLTGLYFGKNPDSADRYFSGSVNLNFTYLKINGSYVYILNNPDIIPVAKATTSLYGLVKPDGTTITVDDGVISADISGYVTTSTTQDITGAKNFKEAVTIQNGAGTGSLIMGADVNASTLSANTRKLGRINAPIFTNPSVSATLLGWDTAGDDSSPVTNNTEDAVCFGGMKKITNCTSPMSITFCVNKVRNSAIANNKVYPLAMDANSAIFGVQPKYNGNNIAVESAIQTLSATDSITLADNTIYNGGEQTALTITLPSTVDVSFLCEIDFTSGTTATTLSYSNTIKWAGDDVNNNVFLPVASKRYTIICAYDGVNYRFTVKGVE